MQSNSHSIAITLTKFFLIPEWTWPSGCNCVFYPPPPPLLIETLFHSSSAANKKNYYTLIFVKSREICFWCEYLTVLSFFFYHLAWFMIATKWLWHDGKLFIFTVIWRVILIPFSQESFYSLAKLIRSKLEWKAYSGDWNAPFPFVYRHRMSSNSSCIHSFIRS